MCKAYLLILSSFFLTSCASSVIPEPVIVKSNSDLILKTDSIKSAPAKIALENQALTILNQLFNTDVANNKMVLMISNESDCDFVMNIAGTKSYSLPVAANKTESIVLEQGEYQMTSEVCNTSYRAFKNFFQNTQLSIRHRVIKPHDSTVVNQQ